MLVGGFLGAGKTTLILRAADLLRRQGMRVAVITNDQDDGLVDTRLAEAQGTAVQEVAGACFCCHFSDLVRVAEYLTAFQPNVIFAEPVGSCVDISATTLQPLKVNYSGAWRLAPYTVLVDPNRAEEVFAGTANPDLVFLFRNQIAEADLVCLTKMDRRNVAPLPFPVDFRLSVPGDRGVREWLNEVLHSSRVVGARILDVDYGRYAEAEAALGWLNLHADLALERAASPAEVAGPLLESIDARLTQRDVRIAHLKIFDRAASGYIKASICMNGEEPVAEGDLTASPAARHELVVNLRALGEPEILRSVIDQALDEIPAVLTIKHAGVFRPAAPRPEHRFSEAV